MNSFPFTEEITNSTGGIDWKFIASIYPADLLLNHHKYTMKTIIQDFLKPQSFERIPNNLASNFLYILQIIMKKLLENNKRAQIKLENQIKVNEELKRKILRKNHGDANDIVKDIGDKTIINKSQISCFLCPVCLNCYTSLKCLDMHFFTHHNELSDIWQILRTPYYNGLTADPVTKLMTTTERSQLKQTFQILSEEIIHEQKDNDMKIKNYFREKLHKFNDKLDQISTSMNKESFNNSHSKRKEDTEIDDEISRTNSNDFSVQNDDYTNSNSNSHSISQSNKRDNEQEIIVYANNQNNNGNNTISNNHNDNIAVNNINLTSSTNIFLISDSNTDENETEIKNKNSLTTQNYTKNINSPSNINSLSNNRIESNMITFGSQTLTNTNALDTIPEEYDDNKPLKVSVIKAKRKDRVKKAVLETDSSYNDT